MAYIVELRGESDEKLEEMLENAREEMFNLRFQKAIAQLQNAARIKEVRREMAQLQEALHKRQLAKAEAAAHADITAVLKDKEWFASASYVYEDSVWQVEFEDEDGNALASAAVDLNKKQPKGRRGRARQYAPQLVTNVEIAG